MAARSALRLLAACGLAVLTTIVAAGDNLRQAAVERGIERLQTRVGGTASVEFSDATGAARLVVFAAGRSAGNPVKAPGADPAEPAREFLREFGSVFGVRDVDAELRLAGVRTDQLGTKRVSFEQVYRGLPVFAGVLRAHYDSLGRLTAVNGNFVPELALDAVPRQDAAGAGRVAVADSSARHGRADYSVAASRLLVFRTNLARGVPGTNHLAWEVEVLGGPAVREFVYVDAHKGDVLDRIAGAHPALERRIYSGGFDAAHLVWSEGNAKPYGEVNVDNLIDFSEDAYNLFASMSGGTFLSWDGVGGLMNAENNSPSIGCPNAAWVGTRTIYCPGVTSDDTVVHEWGHAYTDSTHDLIYQWQSGALNESYSDIWGETADLLNGQGTDTPVPPRAASDCSTFGGLPPPSFMITVPALIAGALDVAGATFNPGATTVSGELEQVDDGNNEAGLGSVTDACQPLIGFTAGRIALLDRGRCSFVTKVLNAQNAGATAVVIVSDIGNDLFTMTGSSAGITIPSVFLRQSDGEALEAEAGNGVSVEIATFVAGDPSRRWLLTEDNPGFGGAIRDMWNPECYVDAGNVTAGAYKCGVTDSGGVHSNSGVSNHNYALLVDGGSYNGQSIAGIGLTKAANIYWRAQSVYQVPTTNFPEHADFLELSCADLLGVPFYEPDPDSPVGVIAAETITQSDCDELAKVLAATEMRTQPTQCAFVPMLEPDAPPVCGGGPPATLELADWESGLDGWTVGTRDVVNPPTFSTPDWAVVSDLPDDRPGSAAFVADLVVGNCADDLEAGVLFLESPPIPVPGSVAGLLLSFDHWNATELFWDGGNVKISVNDGPWSVVPGEAFTFNTYPEVLNGGTNDNPLGGEPAFSGTDGGAVDGSWGQSQVALSALAGTGDTVRLRFELGLDGCNGRVGWYVDDVRLFACACQAGLPQPWFVDADGDGLGSAAIVLACEQPASTSNETGDCDDANAEVWATPGEVPLLTFADDSQTLAWSAPVDPGGTSAAYDVLKSLAPADFDGAGICAESQDGSDALFVDPLVPPADQAWHYLVRAVNACPGGTGTLGYASDGVERVGRTCP